MKNSEKIINNLINENTFHLKVSSLKQDGYYLGISSLCKNTFHIQNA